MTPGAYAWSQFEVIAGVADDRRVVEHALAHPCVMSAGVLNRAFATSPASRAAQVVATLRNRFDRDPGTYPLGPGPLEPLAERVLQGELTAATGIAKAAQEAIYCELAFPYVNRIAGLCTGLAQRGGSRAGWDEPLVIGALLVAATDALAAAASDDEEVVAMRWMAWLSRISVTQEVVHATANGRLFAETVAGAEHLLATPEPSKRLAGDLLFRLGALHMDPWIVSRDANSYPLAIREWRMRGLDATLGEDPTLVPTPEEVLPRAESYLRRAVAKTEGALRGRALKALVQLLEFRSKVLGEAIDRNEMLDRAREGLPLVADLPDPEPHAYLASVLNAYDGGAVPDSSTWQDDSLPADRRAELALIAMRNMPAEQALELVGRTRTLFETLDDEPQRVERWSVALRTMIELHQGTAKGRFAAEVAAVATALDAMQRNDEVRALATLTATPFSPEFAEAFGDVVRYAVLGLQIGAASNAAHDTQWDDAVRHYAAALRSSLALGLANRTGNLVTRIADAALSDDDPFVGLRAVVALASRLPELEQVLGEAVQLRNLELCRAVMARFSSRPMPPDAFLMAHQLVKSVRFGSAVAHGSRWRLDADPRAQQLLSDIAGQAFDPPDEGAIPDEWLLAAYAHVDDLQGGDSNAVIAANRRQTFDRHVRAAFAADLQVPVSTSIDEFQRNLPERTAVVDLYLGADAEGSIAVVSLGITREVVEPGLTSIGFPTGLTRLGRQEHDRVAWQHPLGLLIAETRSAIRESPDSIPINADAESHLMAVQGMLRGMLSFLAKCKEAGKDHLIVIPHGPLHYLPFQLVGGAAAPLANEWTISLAPSLLSLLRDTTASRPRSICSIGLDYVDGRLNPHRLPMLSAARAEAAECAAAFGAEAFLDANATAARLRDGLRTARYVHVSGHGHLDVVAPSFQTLFLAPHGNHDGRVFAYELLADSFAGCELVSLSACESGLGRFDLADNLLGIPSALLAGGVKYVVATLWTVRAAPARLFFRTLYQELARDAACLDAFATAQRATRNSYPAFRDWGAFVITGG